MVFKDSDSHVIKLWMGDGCGSNMRDEVLVSWALLWFVRRKYVLNIQIIGDSKVVIDWVIGSSSLDSMVLDHWISRVKSLIYEFSSIYFRHIYREFNSESDCLSKKEIGEMNGQLFF